MNPHREGKKRDGRRGGGAAVDGEIGGKALHNGCQSVNGEGIIESEKPPFCNHHSNNLVNKKKNQWMLKLFGSLMETGFLQSFKIPPQRLLVTKRKMATVVRKSGGRHLHRTWFNLILPMTGNPCSPEGSCHH